MLFLVYVFAETTRYVLSFDQFYLIGHYHKILVCCYSFFFRFPFVFIGFFQCVSYSRHNIGFPIVECSSEGDFILSKPPDTGGLISFGTVAEQLVYELGNPRQYLLPDVTCDFSEVSITEIPG